MSSGGARGLRRLVMLPLACTACFSLDFTEPTDVVTAPRYLDELCNRGAYELEGDAHRTTGLTRDTCGFELGPSNGAVTFDADPGDLGSFASSQFSVLLADADGNVLDWQRVEPEVSGPFVLRATIGTKLRIVDARFEGTLPSDYGCSLARRHRR